MCNYREMSRGKSNNPRKLPNSFRKFSNLAVPSHMPCRSLRKSLRTISHCRAHRPHNHGKHKCRATIRWEGYIPLWSTSGPPTCKPPQIFFVAIYTQIRGSRQVLGFFIHFLNFCIFFVPWKTKFGQLHVKNTIFSRRAPQILPPKAQDALWQRLAPFQVLSGVLAVQRVITGRSRAVNQIIRENYQTVSGNSQTWQCLHTCHVEAL
jgi:hypothetical protein